MKLRAFARRQAPKDACDILYTFYCVLIVYASCTNRENAPSVLTLKILVIIEESREFIDGDPTGNRNRFLQFALVRKNTVKPAQIKAINDFLQAG
jgi:hypothetical protein